MNFEQLEWERPVRTKNGVVKFKRYGDKLFWLMCDRWIEIKKINYNYDGFEYWGDKNV